MDPLKKLTEGEHTKKVFSLLEEFRNFAFKGNVIDLAVGVIIGAAFGKIVDALVKQVMMPLIAVVMPGDQSYTTWTWKVGGQEVHYGVFLGELVNFLVVSFVLYLFIVKFLGWMMHAKKAEAAAPPPPTREQELLMEIRDLLKARNGQ